VTGANLRNFALWVIIVLLLLALFTLFQNPGHRVVGQNISYSQLLNEVDAGRVRDVLIQGSEVRGTFTDGRIFWTHILPNDPTLMPRLQSKGVSISVQPPSDNVPWFISLLVSWLPFIALIGVWIYLSNQMRGARGDMSGAPPTITRNEFEGLRRQIADMQAEIDRLKGGHK
jgi:cell division protease FtsH